jgi:hypothetical protein
VAVDAALPLLRNQRGGPHGLDLGLARQPGGDLLLLAPVRGSQFSGQFAVPECFPPLGLLCTAGLVPGATAVQTVVMLGGQARVTAARALIAAEIGIEQFTLTVAS